METPFTPTGAKMKKPDTAIRIVKALAKTPYNGGNVAGDWIWVRLSLWARSRRFLSQRKKAGRK